MGNEFEIGDYVLVTPCGHSRSIGPALPDNLDDLGVGHLLGFPMGTDKATRDRLVRCVSNGWLSRRRFKKKGVQLIALRSASLRSMAVDFLEQFSAVQVRSSVFFLVAFVLLTSIVTASGGINLKQTLLEFERSFLGYAIRNHEHDEERFTRKIDQTRAEWELYKNWKAKDLGHAE